MNTESEQLNSLLKNLVEALERKDAQQAIPAQKAFTQAVRGAWEAFDQSETSAKDKALPRLMAEWVIKELPNLIRHPKNYPQIKHQLRLLSNSKFLFEQIVVHEH